MKKIILGGVLALLAASTLHTQALTIELSKLSIAGAAELDGPLNVATKVVNWGNVNVVTVDGILATDGGVAVGDPVTMVPWVFNQPAINLWSVGGYSFVLAPAATEVFRSDHFLSIQGVGLLYKGFNFIGTGDWFFTTQGNGNHGTFSLSAESTIYKVPEGSSTGTLTLVAGTCLFGIFRSQRPRA